MVFESNLCDHVWAPFATSLTTTTVSAILSVITVPGNLLICWAVIWNPTRNLKTSFNYLILNLAIADLIIGAITEPVFVVYHLKEALKHQVLGARWAVYMSFFMSSTASVLSMVALAINRYKMAKQNFTQQWKLSTVVTTAALLWVFSLGLPLLYLTVGFYALAFIFANSAVAISVGVLVFVYYRIYDNLRQHSKNTEYLRSSNAKEKRAKREEKITMSFLLIILSFLACAVPSLLMIYVINLCQKCSCVLIHWFRDLQYLFLLSNSATNQFLYAWRMQSFRNAFQIILGCRGCRRRSREIRVHTTSTEMDEQGHQPVPSNKGGNTGRETIAHCSKKANAGEVTSLPKATKVAPKKLPMTAPLKTDLTATP